MKKYIMTFIAAALAFASACERIEEGTDSCPAAAKLVSMRASFAPESRVVLVPDGESIDLRWDKEDTITVVGASTSYFTVKEGGYGEKFSEFIGPDPGGNSFDILLPGGRDGFATASDIASLSFGSQVQRGNGDMSHIAYFVWMEGVDEYQDVTFSEEWAAAHGGTFHHSGVLKVTLRLPEGTSSVKSIALAIPGADPLTLEFEDTRVGSDRLLTAWFMLPYSDISVEAGQTVTLTAVVNNNKNYSKSFVPGAAALKPGKTNQLQLNDLDWDIPLGEPANPYELRTVDDLKAIKSHLVANDTVFFRLMNDIDLAEEHTWTGVGAGNYEFIHLDGQNHSIKNYHTGTNGFFSVFQGVLENIQFSDVNLTATLAPVATWLGLSNNLTPSTLRNVRVTGSSKSVTSQGASGMVSRITGGCRLIGCSADVSIGTSAAYCGGLIGQVANGAKDVLVKDCSAKVTIVSTNGDGRVGGLVGASAYRNASSAASARNEMTVDGCSLTGSITAAGNFVGGVVGYATDSLAIGNCSVDMDITNTKSYTGGVVGNFAYVSPNTNPGCYVFGSFTVKGSITGTVSVGGIAGYAGSYSAGLSFTDCAVSAAVSGTNGVGGYSGSQVNGWSFERCSFNGTLTATEGVQGGFVPSSSTKTVFRDCVMTADIDGASRDKVGGFIGETAGCEFSGCSFTGNVVSGGGTVGGLVGSSGNVASAFARNRFSGTVTGANYVGGLVGNSGTSNTTVSEDFVNAVVTSTSGNHAGGLLGGTYAQISDCISEGEVRSTAENVTIFGVGGIISYAGNKTVVTNCISTAVVSGNAAVGGIIGGQGYVSQSETPTGKVSGCIAWNPSVTLNDRGAAAPRRGAGAVTGYAPHHITLENCLRRADMAFTNPYGQVLYDQENSSDVDTYISNAGSHYDAATEVDSGQPSYSPYHGKATASGASASSAARTLGWNEEIWNLDGPVPALRWMTE